MKCCASRRATTDLPTPPFSPPIRWIFEPANSGVGATWTACVRTGTDSNESLVLTMRVPARERGIRWVRASVRTPHARRATTAARPGGFAFAPGRHHAARSSGVRDLEGRHLEALERVLAEGHGDRHVARVAAARHHDAADARRVVARVEGVPAVAEEDLEPGAEVHRIRHRRDADVAEIARAIARGDVHAAAQRDRQVREVAADAGPLAEAVQRGARGARGLVVELQVVVDEVADRLHASPAHRRAAEGVPRELHQLAVDLAIAAGEQE